MSIVNLNLNYVTNRLGTLIQLDNIILGIMYLLFNYDIVIKIYNMNIIFFIFDRLVNTLIPGSVKKVNTSSMAFKCMENINNFLAVAISIGVPSQETFQSVDLWERQNLNSVVICLQSLGRKVKSKKIH